MLSRLKALVALHDDAPEAIEFWDWTVHTAVGSVRPVRLPRKHPPAELLAGNALGYRVESPDSLPEFTDIRPRVAVATQPVARLDGGQASLLGALEVVLVGWDESERVVVVWVQ